MIRISNFINKLSLLVELLGIISHLMYSFGQVYIQSKLFLNPNLGSLNLYVSYTSCHLSQGNRHEHGLLLTPFSDKLNGLFERPELNYGKFT